MKEQLTPLTILMAIHLVTRGDGLAGYPNVDRPPQKEVIAWFFVHGIIDREDLQGRATDKAKAWVDLICQTPMPVQLWVDPRDERS